jgi:methionyl-tRNA formyltransferase
MIKIVYLGSPDFSANFLEKLICLHRETLAKWCHSETNEVSDRISNCPIEIIAVLTQPDRPVGRKKILTPTPVKLVAQKHHIPVYEDLNELNNIDFDMGLVFAYSKFIPKQLLDKPKYGFLNIHPSLLPLYRGPSPIAYPLINGDKKTGVTIIKLDEKMDHGDIVAQEEIEIDRNIKRPELETQLTDLALSVILSLERQTFRAKNPLLKSVPQDHSKASNTKLLTKEMGYVEYKIMKMENENAKKIYDLYRGLYPWPGIWTKINVKGVEKRMKITELELIDNKLVIKKVQIEGENIKPYKD